MISRKNLRKIFCVVIILYKICVRCMQQNNKQSLTIVDSGYDICHCSGVTVEGIYSDPRYWHIHRKTVFSGLYHLHYEYIHRELLCDKQWLWKIYEKDFTHLQYEVILCIYEISEIFFVNFLEQAKYKKFTKKIS